MSGKVRGQDHEDLDGLDQMLTAKDVARMFGVKVSRSYELLHQMPSIRVGRSVRIPRSRLEAWIDQQLAERESVA